MRRALWNSTVAVVVALAPSAAQAAPVDDVQVSVGEPLGRISTSYGYAALPIVLKNTSDAQRKVRIVAAGHSTWSYAPSFTRVSRSFVLPPNSTFEGTMLRPPAMWPDAPAVIWVNGESKREMVRFGDGRFAADRGWGGPPRPSEAILVGRNVPVVVSNALENPASTVYGSTSSWSTGLAQPIPIDTIAVDASWPTEWLAYSRFRLIALTEPEWLSVPGPARSAMREAVSAGLDLWIITDAEPSRFVPGLTTAIDVPEAGEHRAAPLADDAARTVSLGLGHVSTIAPNRAPPLHLLERLARPSAVGWRSTFSDDDAENILPVMRTEKLPAGRMLGLLIVFALLIGPINIFLVSRMNRRVLLFVTTPALGAAFSVGVLVFGLAHDGVRARVLTRTVTVLDIKGGLATTLAHSAYFAPFTPRDGLRFDDRTMVIPSMTSGGGPAQQAQLTLDLTEGQHFPSGLVRPRVPTHIRFVHVEPRRERLVFTRNADGAIMVQNGLGVDVRGVYYLDAAGTLVGTGPLASGAEAAMRPVQVADREAGNPVHRVMQNIALFDPAVILGRSAEIPDLRSVPIGGFAALIDGSPFHSHGLDNVREHDAKSLVIGLAEVE
jgi:hypothetical protein